MTHRIHQENAQDRRQQNNGQIAGSLYRWIVVEGQDQGEHDTGDHQ